MGLFVLSETEATKTVAEKTQELVDSASAGVDGFLGIGTKIFDWAMSNPIYMLGIILFLIFAAVGLVKKFSR